MRTYTCENHYVWQAICFEVVDVLCASPELTQLYSESTHCDNKNQFDCNKKSTRL